MKKFTGFIFSITMTTAAVTLFMLAAMPFIAAIVGFFVLGEVLKKSTFAVVKSGTVSLEVCKMNVPSIIIYKMNFINFYLAKFLLNIKFVNMINIINNREIIPELIQSECNPDEIFKSVYYFLKKPDLIAKQKKEIQKTLKTLTSPSSSSEEASNIILSYIS